MSAVLMVAGCVASAGSAGPAPGWIAHVNFAESPANVFTHSGGDSWGFSARWSEAIAVGEMIRCPALDNGANLAFGLDPSPALGAGYEIDYDCNQGNPANGTMNCGSVVVGSFDFEFAVKRAAGDIIQYIRFEDGSGNPGAIATVKDTSPDPGGDLHAYVFTYTDGTVCGPVTVG